MSQANNEDSKAVNLLDWRKRSEEAIAGLSSIQSSVKKVQSKTQGIVTQLSRVTKGEVLAGHQVPYGTEHKDCCSKELAEYGEVQAKRIWDLEGFVDKTDDVWKLEYWNRKDLCYMKICKDLCLMDIN